MTKSIIFETLMLEAESRVVKLYPKTYNLQKTVESVSKTLELTEQEQSALMGRAKKALSTATLAAPVPSAANAPSSKKPGFDKPLTLYFPDKQEGEEATDLLMKKGIAWSVKSTDQQGEFLQFPDEGSFNDAHQLLKHRWDFLENGQRLVANINFDNMSDFLAVFEFMKRQNMLVQPVAGDELDEDYDDMQSSRKAAKLAAAKDGVNLKQDPVSLSLVAQRKERGQKVKTDPATEPQLRRIHVRKKWK